MLRLMSAIVCLLLLPPPLQSHDLVRTRVFKEENRLLSRVKSPFSKNKSLVFSTALSAPAGRAAARYGIARKCAM